MNKQIEKCPHCEAKMVNYVHSLESGTLVKALMIFYSHTRNGIKSVNPAKTEMTKNQYNNFQKLRYWDLVERVGHNGLWKMTYLGIEFVQGRVAVPLQALSYRGEWKEYRGSLSKIYEINGMEYLKAKDYAKNAENISDGNQLKFIVN